MCVGGGGLGRGVLGASPVSPHSSQLRFMMATAMGTCTGQKKRCDALESTLGRWLGASELATTVLICEVCPLQVIATLQGNSQKGSKRQRAAKGKGKLVTNQSTQVDFHKKRGFACFLAGFVDSRG